jgi:hypothetical protein
LGFREAKSDTSILIFSCGSKTVYLPLYVDNIILTTSSGALLQKTISTLQREFAMELRLHHHFLSIIVEWWPGDLFLHQHTYLKDIIDHVGMTGCKPCTTPVDL